MAQSNFITIKAIKPILKKINLNYSYETTNLNLIKKIDYNNESDSNKRVKFINVNPSYSNKLNLYLLPNDLITCSKKCFINKIENDSNEVTNINTARKKKIPIKYIRKKSIMSSVFFSGLVRYPALDV